MRHLRPDAYSAEQVLLNKRQIWGGAPVTVVCEKHAMIGEKCVLKFFQVTRPRPRTSKLSLRILEDENLSSRTPTLLIRQYKFCRISSRSGVVELSALLPLLQPGIANQQSIKLLVIREGRNRQVPPYSAYTSSWVTGSLVISQCVWVVWASMLCH